MMINRYINWKIIHKILLQHLKPIIVSSFTKQRLVYKKTYLKEKKTLKNLIHEIVNNITNKISEWRTLSVSSFEAQHICWNTKH